MASTTQDELNKAFAAVSGQQSSNLEGMANSLADMVAQIGKTQTSQTAAPANAGPSTASTIESIAGTVLKSGFGMVPLVSELLGLFGGGGSPAPAPLVKYAMPAAINFEAADSGSGTTNADTDQFGMPRAYSAGGAGASTPTNGAASGTSGSTASPQITVNVQAMDARSFLDRSTDIAAAVRDAMLNLNSINDVVNDL
jgi:hypothetical protein